MPKNPTDPANITTEEILSATEEEISAIYAEAHAEMVEKLLNFLFTIDDINDARQIYKFFRMKNKMKMEALKAGKISKKEYNAWKAKALMAEKSWLPVQKTLAEDLTRSRQIAASIINNKKCDVYALNYNYATYEIEKGIGASTSFALYDHDTVERLIAKKPNLLPNYKVNDAKDLAWNTKHIRNAVTQGILQGESNQDIAKRMQKVCDMSENASIRIARTATTCAQNSGRIDGYKRAQEMGIDVEQIWVSTLDGRTRHEHRTLMGQKREIGKPFEVDGYKIMFPGDPNAKAFLVYNCRCTLIADVGGSEYNLEERIEENLKKKGMTWDEWVNEQPLPKHYGESKKDYLKRYKEHHKKMKFSDWLEEQAMPDILITKAWSDKKMSNIYNTIKEQNVTDANKFYSELKKLGKPSEVWDKYLLGQLDAIDLKQFEEILKKYLPKETTPAATKTITVHQKAIEAEKQIKYAKSDPMSFDDADMHHVNPAYKGNSGIYSKNCQTCAMTYEARRQGYDVVALGKDPTHSHTYALQTEVGKDQAVAWINKTTGEMPVHLNIPKGKQKYKWLEDTVGHNGERYTLSVRWKAGGAHVINMDRDANGVLRLIDNQRGPNEKHIWTGEKEIKQYLDSVKDIKYALRVDDCVPNPKYFNMITKEAKATPKPKVKHKESLWTNSNIDYSKLPDDPMKLNKKLFSNGKFSITLSDISNKTGLSASEVWEKYTKQELFTEDIKKLDAIIEKFDEYLIKSAEPAKNILDKSLFVNKKMSAVYTDIKKTDVKTANQFYKELQKMGKPSDVWDKYLKGQLPDVDVQKIEKHLVKKYSALEEAMPGESVTGLDIDALSKKKVTGVYNDFIADGDKTTANKFYNELKKIGKDKGYGKQSDVWNKYLLGQLDAADKAKIDAHVIKIKKYTKEEELPPVFDKLAYKDKKMSQVYNDLKAENVTNANKFYNELKSMGKPSYVWTDYLNGHLTKEQEEEIEKYLKKLSSKQQVSSATASAPSGSKLTPEQQKALNDAKEALKNAKDALPVNKKYSGIWKDEVSLSDYTAKKKTLAAKKVYFEDELQKAKDLKNQNPHQPGTSQYDGYIKWNESQIEKFEKLLVSIDEFERLGKEYEKAQKIVEKAQKKVNELTPEAEMYSQERKENAKWYTHSQYRSGDAYYTKWAKPIHATATSGEHSAYYSYTSASGAFNRPLAGFKSPKYSGGSGWDQQYFKGVGKVPLDNEGKGNAIKNLTTFIEKSKTKDDIWIQTAQNFATLEGKGGFLDIPYGKLSSMSDAELQQFVGIENQLGQFVSGSINRGGGSYTPGGMRINIYCPKGSEALYVLGDGAFGKSEHEIILQRGGTYKITRMYWGRDAESGGRKLIVDMELRLEKGYNKYGQ